MVEHVDKGPPIQIAVQILNERSTRRSFSGVAVLAE
jgi:hypothetical protein